MAIGDNKSRMNGFNGILVFGKGFMPTVERNECEKNGQHGILIAEGASGIIRENTTRDNNLGGIAQDGAGTTLTIEANHSAETVK
jgi:parallel beta-helix repeat protein